MRQLVALCLLLCSPAASAVVTGRVMDEDGKPLRGVRVRARAQETGQQWYARVLSKSPEAVVLASAQTGDDGAFRVDGKGHAVVNLAFDAPGRHSVVHQVADGDDTGAIVLRAMAARRGRVTANGKGVAGATVVHNGEVVARTDASGHYEAPARPLERIIVVHPDHGVAVHHPATGEVLSYDVALQPAPPIAGRVVDASGAAVRDAAILVDGWPLAASGEDGAFHVAHGVTDARMIVARDASRAGSLLLAEAKPPYVIRLRPATSIAGTARSTTDERPVPVARVCAHAAKEALWWSCVLTDAKGGYVIDGLEPGTHRVSVSHPAYIAQPDARIEVAEGARVAHLLLVTPYGRLAGRVTDEQQRPVAAAQVQAMPDQLTLTAPDGTFSVRTTDWQPQLLHVSKASFAPESFGPVTVGAGETKQGLEIRLLRNVQLTIRVTAAASRCGRRSWSPVPRANGAASWQPLTPTTRVTTRSRACRRDRTSSRSRRPASWKHR